MVSVRWDLLLPDPAKMLGLAIDHHEYFLGAWGETLRVSIYASLLAILVAILLASVAIRYTFFERLFSPLVAISQSFPLQAIAPLLIIALGRGDTSKVTVAFLIAFFPLFAATLSALKNTPEPLLALCKTTGASFTTAITHVYLPAAVPSLLAGAKVAFTLAVLGAVVAEFISPTGGIGRLLLRAQSDYNVEGIYICILMLVCQGVGVFLAIGNIESRIIPRWR